MFWADKIAKHIIDSGGHRPFWVDDMFTPSGFAHIGSLRGPLVHDMVYRAFGHIHEPVTYTYVFNDFDPIDGLPPELISLSDELGKPLRTARSPEKGYESFAEYFTKDFKKVLKDIGVSATYLSSWDMYREGTFNGVIREALDNSEKIQDIYQRVSGSKKREKGWMPLQVICEKCGKLGTTRVHDWDGDTVKYTCEPTMVTWAKGCGYTGSISPFDGRGKLPWKVDWPAHWKVLGVTIEGAGKDHSSAGGSRDIAKALCEEVFHISNPYNLPYEFILIGGKKMSSSKGLGLKARDLTNLLPSSVGRFLFTRTDYRRAIEFDPMGTMAIPDIFDEYDRCWQAYNEGGDEELSHAFEYAQTGVVPLPVPGLFIPRFRDIANYRQLPNVDLQGKLEAMKGSPLSKIEHSILADRLPYTAVWLDTYAPDEYRYQISLKRFDEITLSAEQWKFLNDLSMIWPNINDPEKLQSEIFRLAKTYGIDHKEAFQALYMAILDKTHGPRAGWLMKKFPTDVMVERLTLNKKTPSPKPHSSVQRIDRPDLFSIDPKVHERYPSVSIGIALIRDVRILKINDQLENEKKEFLTSLAGLTTEQLGLYPEIISYRKLYKEMGIDWHSRRPSPEALLRRVALGKGLYTINSCVDAYNLVVMKHRISVGAFDFNAVKFPTILRYAGEGDEILLLGDEAATKYTAKELAYYDQNGGYNIDFNFRDAQRSMVTEQTKNIWINVDGVYDISPEQVEKSLKESVEMIIKYCGGTVEFEGVVL
ncbi:MAG: lysine--tRNA ligase [Candidatus Gottesmanbacteria bacterium]|nr:lysine--tRNA ligase [Candidatus Gottesmanbacteria bacterium]